MEKVTWETALESSGIISSHWQVFSLVWKRKKKGFWDSVWDKNDLLKLGVLQCFFFGCCFPCHQLIMFNGTRHTDKLSAVTRYQLFFFPVSAPLAQSFCVFTLCCRGLFTLGRLLRFGDCLDLCLKWCSVDCILALVCLGACALTTAHLIHKCAIQTQTRIHLRLLRDARPHTSRWWEISCQNVCFPLMNGFVLKHSQRWSVWKSPLICWQTVVRPSD